MSAYFIVLLLVLATSASIAFESDEVVKAAISPVPSVTITPIKSTSSPTSIQDVFQWRNCDGVNGTILAYRVAGCAPHSYCELPADKLLNVELDVIPSKRISQLGMRLRITRKPGEAPIPFVNMPFEGTAVEEGLLVRIFASGMATQDYKGQLIDLQYSYYDVESGEDEVCGQAFFQVV